MDNQAKYAAETMASIIGSQALTIGKLKQENDILKSKNASLQDLINEYRKESAKNEPINNHTTDKQKH